MKKLLQIHRIKLQDYIQSALIAADKYLGDEVEKDIQSKNPDFLVLSDGYFKELDEHQILLELILTDEENEKLIKVDDIYYMDFPLPITRIKKIYVQDEDIKKHIIINVDNSEKGFSPERLFDTFSKDDVKLFEKKDYSELSKTITKSDFIYEITLFNKRLGMFSFMKNTNIYYSNDTGIISNYSNNYLLTLKDYLSKDKDKSELLNILKENNDFKVFLYTNNQMDKDFIETVYNKIEDMEIKEIFSKVLEPNNILKTLPLLLEKEAYVYYFICLVYYFRQKDSNKKDNFKQEIKNLIPKEIAETALAILGIYFGYKILRANEKIELNDKIYKEIFGSLFNIKFKLDSKLDYITIESLYQRSFQMKSELSFEYLEYPESKNDYIEFKDSDKFKQNYNYEEEIFFDEVVFLITKFDGIKND